MADDKSVAELRERLAKAEAKIQADAAMKAELRESEDRQAYFLELSDKLRTLADQEEIQAEAMRLLGEKIAVNRAQYYIADETGEYLSSSGGYSNGIPAAIGRFHLIDFGKYAYDGFHAGETQVLCDATNDPRISEEVLRSYKTVGFMAYIGVPFVQRGRLVGTLAVHQSEPRQWTASEKMMIEETSERTGIAVEQARAESALRESEEKYRTLFDSMVEGFYYAEAIFDEHGRCVDLLYLDENAAAVRIIGQSAKGRRLSELGPYEQHWRDTFGHTAKTGEPQRLELFAAPDSIWYEFFVFKPAHTRGNEFAVVFNDVTARHQALVALRESEERQAFLLELSDTLRAEQDAGAIAARAMRLLGERLNLDRCYIVANRPGEDLWDVGAEFRLPDLPAMPPVLDQRGFPEALRLITEQTLVIDDTAKQPGFTAVERADLQALGFGGLLMAVLRKGKGKPVWSLVGSFARPHHWTSGEIKLFEDVAERTWAAIERARAETALRESEERFQQFANASSGAIWIRNAETLAMEYVSPAIETIYGVSQQAFLGDMSRWAAMIVPEDREIALAHIEQARRGEPAIHEFRIQRPSDRSFRWIRSTDFPLRDTQGNIERVGGIAEDITEEKLSVEHQGVLLAELQHRVRNIMAVLRSITARTAENVSTVKDYAEVLTGRLNTFARVQALLTRGANAGVGLTTIVEDELAALAHHQGQFTIEGPDVTLSPKAAETMTLAVHELTTNALKYGGLSESEGKVAVHWEVVEKGDQPWLSFDWAESAAPPRPSSPGPRRVGFGSELIEGRIPYELKGRGKVTIAEGGAQCHLEFPLQEGASILETGAPRRATVFGGAIDMTGQADLTGQRILIVEDDYYLASDTARALKGAGAEILGPCATEEDARSEIAATTPTCAVLDINLRGGRSFDLAGDFKRAGVPFVFITGYDQDVIPERFEGVTRLQKPVEFRHVIQALAETLEIRS